MNIKLSKIEEAFKIAESHYERTNGRNRKTRRNDLKSVAIDLEWKKSDQHLEIMRNIARRATRKTTFSRKGTMAAWPFGWTFSARG